MSGARDPEAGIVLVNVLVILTLAASIVYLMLSTQDFAIEGVRLRSAAAQADALALGGEASARIALRRDMVEHPEADHYAEPWALAQQEAVTLATGGTFAVDIEDLQARYDLNRLGERSIAGGAVFAGLLAALDLPAEIGPRIAALIARDGLLAGLDQVAEAGVSPAAIEALRPHVWPMDGLSDVNLNTAGIEILSVLLGNRNLAQRLIRVRERAGFLSASDLTALGAVKPAGAGFRSDNYQVRVTAEVDGVTRRLTSRLRRFPRGERQGVVILSRSYDPEITFPAPPDAIAVEDFLSQ